MKRCYICDSRTEDKGKPPRCDKHRPEDRHTVEAEVDPKGFSAELDELDEILGSANEDTLDSEADTEPLPIVMPSEYDASKYSWFGTDLGTQDYSVWRGVDVDVSNTPLTREIIEGLNDRLKAAEEFERTQGEYYERLQRLRTAEELVKLGYIKMDSLGDVDFYLPPRDV